MSITGMVETARKAKCPIVGIPIAGERPFCIRRDLLVQSLKGLQIVDAGIQLALDGKPDRLVVYASGDRVQAIRRFAPAANLYRWNHPNREWAEKARAKRLQPVAKLTGRDKQMARLHKQLAKLGKPKASVHPLLDKPYADTSERMHECGSWWAAWKRQAHIRRWIQLQARDCRAGKINTTALYRVLTERGLQVNKWSDLRTHDKERCEDMFGYLGKLWEFCGLTSKPSYYFEPEDEPRCGPELYKHWLEHLHEYKELENMIQGLQEVGA